jgi:hypothetical protein
MDHDLHTRYSLRVEIRNMIRPGANVHYWTIRAGVVFR